MQYCTRCLNPANHPGGITFDERGVCSGCLVHEEIERIDWNKRWDMLVKLVDHYRCKDGSNYDCLIGVSGGKDSQFIVHVVKNLLKLNPLLVTYNHQYNTKAGTENLANMIKEFDCDHIRLTQKPSVIQRIGRQAMKMMGDFCWHCHAGIATFPIRMAVQHRIPLVIWGDHGLQDMVGMFSHDDMVEYTKKVVNEHAKRGYDYSEFIGKEGLTKQDLLPFIYPTDEELEDVGVRGIYLANFIRWSGKDQAEFLIENHGFQSLEQERTNNCYENVECWHGSGSHDYLKYLKYGYGRATDTLNYDIRFGRISRKEAIELIKHYDGRRPDNMDLVLESLGMTEEEFINCVETMRDPDVWEKDGDSKWVAKDWVGNHANDPHTAEVALPVTGNKEYICTNPPETDRRHHLM